ncbi:MULTISPECIES: ATP-binding cassette domain-containing protein [unclassified Schaalia]|uniref:ATP-binding cassette domain-containing protein n=1 Tax=unclassified Schaalia TaxID=2691889 RepID=UPI001E5B0BB7|nr:MULTISPECIES: ATP-binding cassette domain-containing protein [unclassified Schaalia]MCD4550231.1 ATP-binding cassette domain-containing protein [Schaalia sp. lx-260]MCD4558149.1 ATP-binding cassette domain-containing protein [Schaalia sp. lx-100]
MLNETPLLELRKITKRFGGVEALVDVHLRVNRHEVVALVGDNAAGKSTLARIISGVLSPSSGLIRLDGQAVVIPNTQAALSMGIAPVFQELALCDNLDVASNIFLGQEQRQGFFLDEASMVVQAREYLDQLNSRIPDVTVPLYELSAGQRQCVAIARTLVSRPRLVILDEPTASLSVSQTAEVLTHIERLRDLGLGVIFISHNLTDVTAVADRVEVLRHGRNNGSFTAQKTAIEDIIAAITGATRVK